MSVPGTPRLAAESTAVELPEVQGLLKHYLQMLTGCAWQIGGAAEVGYRPPFEAPRARTAGRAVSGVAGMMRPLMH